jgi:hypothetical protein
VSEDFEGSSPSSRTYTPSLDLVNETAGFNGYLIEQGYRVSTIKTLTIGLCHVEVFPPPYFHFPCGQKQAYGYPSASAEDEAGVVGRHLLEWEAVHLLDLHLTIRAFLVAYAGNRYLS